MGVISRPKVFIFFILIVMVEALAFGQQVIERDKLLIFFSPSCHECIKVRSEFMPSIVDRLKGRLRLEYIDISDINNYKLLLALEDNHKVRLSNYMPIFYFNGNFLEAKGKSVEEIEKFIIDASIAPAQQITLDDDTDLMARFKAFTPFVIIGAGLVDGINPCAFTVIVFFISFLVVQGYRRKELLLVGLIFIFAVFTTYFLVGLGIFGFLFSVKSFWLFTKIFNISIGIFCIILALAAIFDFFKYIKTKQTEGMILQLPVRIKNQIHKVIGLHYRKDKDGADVPGLNKGLFKVLISALITGFIVSILEAVCTGQTYLPTIAFILKSEPFNPTALTYLLLYNFMFVVPLLLILFLALMGVTSNDFSRFVKKNFLLIKILMALMFIVLGVYLIWKR